MDIDKRKKCLGSRKAESTKSLVFLTEALQFSDQQLKDKWCEQLLYKLHIIHNVFENAQCNICLENLKVDKKSDNLVLVNVSQHATCDTELIEDASFKAPELVNCRKRSKAGDIWAAGICIYFINNLSFPWNTATKNDNNFCLWSNNGVFPCNLNNIFLKTSMEMLCVDPKKRPSIETAIKEVNDKEVDENVLSKLKEYCIFYTFN